MVNIREWLKNKHPKVERNELTSLDVGSKDLEGKLTLELGDFANLEKLDCSNNLLTEIAFSEVAHRGKKSSKKPKLEWNLKKVNLSNNNFAKKNLSSFAKLTKLEELLIGNNDSAKSNNFFGSLRFLQNLNALKRLDISDTDIDSGLECLPENLEKIYCFSIRENAKVKNISQLLEVYGFEKDSNGWFLINVKQLKEKLIRELCQATEEGNEELVKQIIENHKSIISLQDEHGNTALHYASSKGELEIVDLLAKKQAGINVSNKENNFTPLHIAVGRDNWDIVIKLLERGADINSKDKEGNTSCHFAAEGNNLKLLKLLHEKGGDLDEKNNYGWSVLHSAASGIINEKEDWEIIKWLLEKGVKSADEEKSDFTVRQVFLQKDHSYAKIYDELVEKFKQEERTELPNK